MTAGVRGAVVFLTGLSGAGKSTIAEALAASPARGGSRSQHRRRGRAAPGLRAPRVSTPRPREANVRRAAELAEERARDGAGRDRGVDRAVRAVTRGGPRDRRAVCRVPARLRADATRGRRGARPKGPLREGARGRDSRLHRHRLAVRGAVRRRPRDRHDETRPSPAAVRQIRTPRRASARRCRLAASPGGIRTRRGEPVQQRRARATEHDDASWRVEIRSELRGLLHRPGRAVGAGRLRAPSSDSPPSIAPSAVIKPVPARVRWRAGRPSPPTRRPFGLTVPGSVVVSDVAPENGRDRKSVQVPDDPDPGRGDRGHRSRERDSATGFVDHDGQLDPGFVGLGLVPVRMSARAPKRMIRPYSGSGSFYALNAALNARIASISGTVIDRFATSTSATTCPGQPGQPLEHPQHHVPVAVVERDDSHPLAPHHLRPAGDELVVAMAPPERRVTSPRARLQEPSSPVIEGLRRAGSGRTAATATG